ncbi:TIM-barrel domain-containing protein [Alicyclobacillus mengziensis]|uniref:TIM-barrel domain-containing protein n=1 Tax=Alicyclobacillus mengziensis TaxID=2931921 RepID=UPI0020129C25|nr:TIM-barrel domain-containing protein [Alicyclobacillus mengziensis]
MGYINPFLVDTSGQPGVTNLYQIAKSRGYFVKQANGQPVQFSYPNFKASLIDLTNPKARTWLEGIMEHQLVKNGFSGWMADFGEELPLNVTLANGMSGAKAHNEYPVLWAKVNQDVMQKSGLGHQGLFFMRSGFSTSPAVTSDFWLGDQLESWDAQNGLASSIIALLSSGLSGYSLESSDIGGYTSISQFPFDYVRTQELLMRWIEVDAFTTLFRSHEGNQPQKNIQVYSNQAVIDELRKFSILFKDLAPYREQLMKQASATGAPVDRPLFFNYPDDPQTYDITYQEFMMGRDVLIAPITKPGVTKVRVYLPHGSWVHLWDHKTYDVTKGTYVEVSAPIGKPAVFYRAASSVANQFQRALSDISKAGAE